MLGYIVRRILIMIPTLIAISIVIFTIINLPPGDYFSTYIAELQSSGEAADLAKINDDRFKLIRDYAGSYDNITDPIADRLALGALDLESRRHELKVRYYNRFKSVLSPKTAARFLQVENQILLLLDLQIAASLPIAQ